ncbi:hypothetical protein [Candidatus Nitrosocosmicus arcticus]|uniref:ArnR1-like winged helix-turn-helix domain-containing protein n=1 Tax=Candidatus Nitrosocosmicus arcticus TaxID=2035267 RepID=A0A557SRG8_9ARCH|nr:hypothetical protein [Candidatus Nitrosocosmicus arcticus]TVP39198.1 hypothetical protein NARC_180009 [Candidatus Nitrosocosmicus arcticus]
MNQEDTRKKKETTYLKASITESILLSCLNGSLFSEIETRLQAIRPSSELILKEYLQYLVNNSFISYHRIKKIYMVEPRGLELLYIIYTQRNLRAQDYADLVIKIG